MDCIELIKTESELTELADLLAKEAKNSGRNAVSRYSYRVSDVVAYRNGKKTFGVSNDAVMNTELMDKGIYMIAGCELTSTNFKEATVARDVQESRFTLNRKNVELPSGDKVVIHDIPSNIDFYDDELREISKTIIDSTLARSFMINQRIVVNSEGGSFIESIPQMSIGFSEKLIPVYIARRLWNVCDSDNSVKQLKENIQFIADPTPCKAVRNSKTLTQAFTELHKISGLKYGSLEDAGIELKGLYDVIMLSGISVHEIFGHHFEQPVYLLGHGHSGTFKKGQNIENNNITLSDNPKQEIGGLPPVGFTHFDAYGRTRNETMHIKDGRVIDFLGSEYADLRFMPDYLNVKDSSYTGSAVQGIDGLFPQARMSCTVLDGKTEKVDLEGKIVIVPSGGHTIPDDKTYVVDASECYVIKGGEPKRVIPLKVTGGINQALYNMSLVDEWTYETGTCSKPDIIFGARGVNAKADVSQYCRNQVWRQQQVYPLPIQENHLRILFNS